MDDGCACKYHGIKFRDYLFFCLHCHIAFLILPGVCSRAQNNEKLTSMQPEKPELQYYGETTRADPASPKCYIISSPSYLPLTIASSPLHLITSSLTTLSYHHHHFVNCIVTLLPLISISPSTTNLFPPTTTHKIRSLNMGLPKIEF